jgi:hypothetical protein
VSKLWSVLKYVAAIGLVVFAALIALGWYLSSTKETARKNSAFIQKLEQAERDKGDLLHLLFDGIATVSDDDAKLVVDWLTERQFRGDQPYLYIIGLYYGKQESKIQKATGIGYLAKAGLVYRIDAIKCGDPTANQAVQIFEGVLGLKALRDRLKGDPAMRQATIDYALKFEEKNQDRPLPSWICLHGMGPGSPPGVESFQLHRQMVRTQFEGSF